METYIGLFTYKTELGNGGITIFQNTIQGIGEWLSENLESYIEKGYLDRDEEEWARSFILKVKNHQVSINDLDGYACVTSIGSESIPIIGNDCTAFAKIAEALFELGNDRSLGEAIHDPAFDEMHPENYLDPKELLCYQLYLTGQANRIPDQNLIDKIESAFIVL